MPNFDVELRPDYSSNGMQRIGTPTKVVVAEYFQHEDGWMTFKDARGKVVCAINEGDIRAVNVREATPDAVSSVKIAALEAEVEQLNRVVKAQYAEARHREGV